MLTKRQNLLETIRGGTPDRFVNQYEPFHIIVGSPFSMHNPNPKYGEENVVNAWGETKSWPIGTPGPFPVHTPDKIVIKNMENWRDYVKVPQTVYDAKEWEPFIAEAAKVDRSEQYVTAFVAPGVFEMCHHLMGMEDCLVSFYEYPDEMHELIDCLTQFELELAAETCKYLKPDALFHHDDFGSQISTFLSPEMFREFIKPAYEKIYGYYKAHGVELIIHHSDSFAATLVQDMIDVGIDIWQGVMTTNNVPELIQKHGGKISFMGDIDSAKVDYEGWTPEVVQREVERACKECGKLYFIPNGSQGLPMSTFPGVYEAISDAIDRCSRELFPAQQA